jgi:hypothetical protein
MAHGMLSALSARLGEARDTAEDFGRDARDRLHGAEGSLRDRGHDARAELRHLWGQMEDLLEQRLAPGARQAGVYAREGRDMALNLTGQLRDAARHRPMLAIGLVVGATWLVASLLRRR